MIRTNSSIHKNKVSANIAILSLLMRKDFNKMDVTVATMAYKQLK